ncbi:MAG: hypothetical protein AB8G16_15220 [Gammaproteobacteria bacterium]
MIHARRNVLLGLGSVCLLASLFLPAASVNSLRFNGIEIASRMLTGGYAPVVAASANLVVPLLAVLHPRWRRLEMLLLTIVLAAAAWLTSRVFVSPVVLHVGVCAWWVAMLVFGALAFQARRHP